MENNNPQLFVQSLFSTQVLLASSTQIRENEYKKNS